MKISRVGEAPDYRFSLANERTFLAWIGGGRRSRSTGSGFCDTSDS